MSDAWRDDGTRGDVRLEWTGVIRPGPEQASLSLASGWSRDGSLVALARGLGGHLTGWLPGRLVVRGVMDAWALPEQECVFGGAADELPDEWGWAGARQGRGGAEYVFGVVWGAWRSASPRAAVPASAEALAPIFERLDRAVQNFPTLGLGLSGQCASCTALRLEGDEVTAVQCGETAAWRLEAATGELSPLSMSDTLMGVVRSKSPVPDHPLAGYADELREPEQLSQAQKQLGNVVFAALGASGKPRLTRARVAPGDVVLLTTQGFFERVGEARMSEQLAEVARHPERRGAICEALSAVMEEADGGFDVGVLIGVVKP